MPREKVLAAIVRLLDMTFIRVGNDEYATLYRSFGLTTLRGRHASVKGTTVRFRFKGKSGRQHDVSIRDRRLAGIVRRCRDLPGQELFTYVDADGEARDVASDDVNAYIREAAGTDDISAKDFRTWAGTVMAYKALRAVAPPDAEADVQRAVVAAVRETADHLGNTPAVTRQSYVHPAVIEGYLDDDLREALLRTAGRTVRGRATRADEAAVLALLKARNRPARRRPAAARRVRSARR
jgi:DNA topoisomerase-1